MLSQRHLYPLFPASPSVPLDLYKLEDVRVTACCAMAPTRVCVFVCLCVCVYVCLLCVCGRAGVRARACVSKELDCGTRAASDFLSVAC
jgi:hypothetical protein